jgi:hypothetical protein
MFVRPTIPWVSLTVKYKFFRSSMFVKLILPWAYFGSDKFARPILSWAWMTFKSKFFVAIMFSEPTLS